MSQPLRTRIKFCGNTRAEDLALAVELGVDFLGLVLVPGSARAVSPERAAELVSGLPMSAQTVALFQNASAEAVQAAKEAMRPALLQFHGREPPDFCAGFGLPWFKAVPMGEPQHYADWEQRFAAATALLADSHTTQGGGGSGQEFVWSQLPATVERSLPLLLAGGLTPETVAEAIRTVRPWGVDVSSGIESGTKGVKDHRKMRAFVAAVRQADEALHGTPHG